MRNFKDTEFNKRLDEYNEGHHQEYNYLPKEKTDFEEYNGLPLEFSSYPEDNDQNMTTSKRKSTKDRSLAKGAMQLAATCLMAIIVIVTASSLANGSFLPEVSAAVDSVLTELNDPFIDPKSGMDPSEFAILFKDDQDPKTPSPEQTDDTSDKDETTNDQSDTTLDTDITEIIDCDKEGHLFSDWYYLSYPSCTQKGELYHTCQRCGEVETGYS